MEKLIEVFQKSASSVPAYKKILAAKGLHCENVKTLEDFGRMVPVLYKKDLFEDYSSEDLCMPGSIESLASAIVTSGTSGSFAYKVITKKEMDLEKAMIDTAFDTFFNASKIKTCIINVNPMGVSFVSSYPVIPTSVRSDIAWHVIKSFSKNFEQIIIIGDPNFVKKLIEEGRKTKFEGAAEKLKFVVGGDWSPASYFEYLKETLATQTQDNLFSTFGTTEIGLNIGMADNSLQEIRKFIQANKEAQRAVFGTELNSVPAIFFFDPSRTYIEKINKDLPFSELAFTTLSDVTMPFIRYSTGDCGTIVGTDALNKILADNGRGDLAIKLPMPILAVSGRMSNKVTTKKITISAEDIKQMLYSNIVLAKNITGDFRLSAAKSSFNIDLQLAREVKYSKLKNLIKKTAKTLEKSISVKAYEYQKFPYNITLDYESKWAYTKT